MYKRKYTGHANCIFCPQRPKGKPIITYTQQATAPKYPSAEGSSLGSTSAYVCWLCAISSWKKFAWRDSTGGKTQVNTAGISTRVHHTLQLRTGNLFFSFSFKKYTRGKRKFSLPELHPLPADHKPIQGFLSHGLNVRFPKAKAPRAITLKWSQKRELAFSHASMADSTFISIWPPGIQPNSSPENV